MSTGAAKRSAGAAAVALTVCIRESAPDDYLVRPLAPLLPKSSPATVEPDPPAAGRKPALVPARKPRRRALPGMAAVRPAVGGDDAPAVPNIKLTRPETLRSSLRPLFGGTAGVKSSGSSRATASPKPKEVPRLLQYCPWTKRPEKAPPPRRRRYRRPAELATPLPPHPAERAAHPPGRWHRSRSDGRRPDGPAAASPISPPPPHRPAPSRDDWPVLEPVIRTGSRPPAAPGREGVRERWPAAAPSDAATGELLLLRGGRT